MFGRLLRSKYIIASSRPSGLSAVLAGHPMLEPNANPSAHHPVSELTNPILQLSTWRPPHVEPWEQHMIAVVKEAEAYLLFARNLT